MLLDLETVKEQLYKVMGKSGQVKLLYCVSAQRIFNKAEERKSYTPRMAKINFWAKTTKINRQTAL